MTDNQQLRKFLDRVVPWSCHEDRQTFIGIHWTVLNQNEKIYWTGRAVRTVDEAIKEIKWAASLPNTRDIYVAMGSQKECEEVATKNGYKYLKPIRNQQNVAALKTLFLDIDVKDEDKGYLDQKRAAIALMKFCEDVDLPRPTLVVSSGGGLHCHWALDRPLSSDEWKPLANALAEATRQHDLKCDTQVTVDSARILRPPETLNFKSNPPRATRIIGKIIEEDYSVERIKKALEPYLKASPSSKGNEPIITGQVSSKLIGIKNEAAAGITTGVSVSLNAVSKECPFIKEALDTAGERFGQPLWNLTTLIATFTEDPALEAHRMSRGHSDYEPATTDALLERKIREQAEKEIGWPSCKAILDAGFEKCRECSHLKKLKSPLNFGYENSHKAKAITVLSNTNLVPLADVALPDIPGGIYDPDKAMLEISARFALVDRDGEVITIHRTRTGKDNILTKGSFEHWLRNIYVRVQSDERRNFKIVRASEWWLSHMDRPPPRTAVFEPHGVVARDEYNFWRGFGVRPEIGTKKIRRFLHHVRSVICKRNTKKLKYLIRWLAWSIQNPEKNPETALVFKGEGEGSGKSTVSQVMVRIMGPHHAMKVNTTMQLLGTHVDYLEFVCLLMIEEALFAGDPRTADQVKDFITGTTIHINPKGRRAYNVPNMISAILTTNHDWAVPAGTSARRWFVCEVDEGRTYNRTYFNALYDDLEAGGYGQLLNFFQNVKLGSWHPRELVRTEELRDQQFLSASPIKQWLRVCAEDGEIPSWENGERSTLELGKEYTSAVLYDAYVGSRKAAGGGGTRIEGRETFGRTMKKVLGEGAYNKNVIKGTKRSPGYFIPKASELLRKVEISVIGAGDLIY